MLSKVCQTFVVTTALVTCYPIVSAIAQTVELTDSTDGTVVTLRVQVEDKKGALVKDLSAEKFTILTDGEEIVNAQDDEVGNLDEPPEKGKFKLTSPNEAAIYPTHLIFLLDVSGSMNNEIDSDRETTTGETKLDDALMGIDEFIRAARELLKQRREEQPHRQNGPIRMAVIPYGERGENACSFIRNVDFSGKKDKEIFFDIETEKNELDNSLKDLQEIEPCATSNIYGPLKKSVEFLGGDPRAQGMENFFSNLTSSLLNEVFNSFDRARTYASYHFIVRWIRLC